MEKRQIRNKAIIMIAFIFPPQWIPNHPYLAPFILSSRVKSKVLKCDVHDLNLLFYQKHINEKDLKTFHNIDLFFNPIKLNKALENNKIISSDKFASIGISSAYFKYKAYRSEELWKAVVDKNNYFCKAFKKYLKSVDLTHNKIVGISIVSYSQIIPGLILANLIKKINPNIKIIVGGDMISRIADNLIKDDKIWLYVDAIISGEGEYAIDKIAEMLKKGKEVDFNKVPNAITKNNNKLSEKDRFNFKDSIIPDYSDINLNNYLSPFPIATIEMSRGCYWAKCRFCETTKGHFKSKDVNNLVTEVEFLYNKYNVRHFSFSDIALPPKSIFEFANKIIKRKLPIFWKGMIRAEKIFAEKDLSVLYQSGCRMILMGIESADCDVLKKINKGIDVTLLKNILYNFQKNNIWTHGYFIINFPGETKEQIFETLNFIKNNNSNINSFAVSKFVLLRDSDFFKNSELFNIKIQKNKKDDLKTAYFKYNNDLDSKTFKDINSKLNEILKIHPYNYSKWNNLDINYLFLYVTQNGIKYFLNTKDHSNLDRG